MNELKIRKYAKLMTELGLTGLEISEENSVLRLERGAASPVVAPAMMPAPADKGDEDGVINVCSPMVGVFYAAPAENAEPFVNVGDRVKAGQTLCIIEAMKLMNEIPAEQGGEIVEVCVRNGQAVDYGCTLFRVRR